PGCSVPLVTATGVRMSKRILLMLLASALFGNAQEYRATLTGRVTDAQGAVIPNARLTVVSESTGAKSETISGTDGVYTVPFLPPGQYSVTAEGPGFKRYVREGLQLSTGERVGVDIQMEVGQTAESVTITAEAPLLNTETATVGQVIGAHEVENLPMNG